ncbi:exo-alpha-sialidase [Lacihabitans sp. LS3-19]|uniref:sialidase family protein n=1 Tax=Lacihabitans sp. LS3-19 TaxID=2487335 RepID=UPI0020CF8A3A|nr:sialidase family protein [Lacihabitans sp. LS3-19]MCP9769237.1 exo-alpha-sialidase [Lacihabitans sp. LS3-19]
MERSKYLKIISFFLFLNFTCFAQTPIFTSGTEGYKSFRIPAIVTAKNGCLIAFAEGRVNNARDFGNIDLVMRKSCDKGKTWSKLKIVVDNDDLQVSNNAPVFDFLDPEYPEGRLFLFYNAGNNHENEVRKGHGKREVFYVTSIDNGDTWSPPLDITSQTHRPSEWRSYANTPGHALQLTKGSKKGRLFVPANHSEGEPLEHFEDYHAHAFYSDDHGKTFKLSESLELKGSNEATAAELSNNRLMLNTRNQKGDIKQRIVAISDNNGETWTSEKFNEKLIDPVCEGSLLNIGGKKLAFTNAADINKRNNLTLRISKNEGKTWPKSVLIDANDGKGDFTAYSDIVKIGKRKIGVLYERDNYKEIVFKIVKW